MSIIKRKEKIGRIDDVMKTPSLYVLRAPQSL